MPLAVMQLLSAIMDPTGHPKKLPTSENINAVVQESDTIPDIAVGAGGMILER